MIEYETMLDELYEKLPEKVLKKERFEPPEFISFIQGSQTVVRNFVDVAETLRRDPRHLFKYITRELATAGVIENKRLVLQGKFREDVLNKKLTDYIKEYVLCRECQRPDTSIVEIEGVKHIRCEACGARAPVRPL